MRLTLVFALAILCQPAIGQSRYPGQTLYITWELITNKHPDSQFLVALASADDNGASIHNKLTD
jgi:hypothetical protein